MITEAVQHAATMEIGGSLETALGPARFTMDQPWRVSWGGVFDPEYRAVQVTLFDVDVTGPKGTLRWTHAAGEFVPTARDLYDIVAALCWAMGVLG